MAEHDVMPKCADCGFLTLRNQYTGQLEDMDGDFRRTGNPARRKMAVMGGAGLAVREAHTTPFRHIPICFARSVNLAGEWPGSKGVLDQYEDWPAAIMLGIITKERPECIGKFTAWEQGFTPKEHREMLDQMKLRGLEEQQRDEDRKWRLVELAVFGFVATIVGAGVAILAAFIQRGSWP